MIEKLWKGIPKWFILSTILTLVSVATIHQTYSTLNTQLSIAASKHTAHIYSSYANMTATTESVLLHETVPMVVEHNPGLAGRGGHVQKPRHYNMPVISDMKMNAKTVKSKIKHIGFLKVHKAGSTTMQNIFFRFGLKYNLTFVLPKSGHYFLSAKSAMSVKPGSHWDILACHSVYSRKLFGAVLPPDSVNIGIIRKPLERMVSAAYYYRDVWKSPLLVKVPRANFIHNLINRPDLYETKPFTKTKNAMGQDFGFPSSTKINDTQFIEKHLDLLKHDFKQILVMERFDESLILMKRTLNWELSDIIYLKTNSHDHKPVIVNSTELQTFKSTCFLDYTVYNTFYGIFDKKVNAEGEEFSKEVEHFRSVLEQVKGFCEQINLKKSSTILTIVRSEWNEMFEVTEQDCFYMEMKELKFVAFLKQRHELMNIVHERS